MHDAGFTMRKLLYRLAVIFPLLCGCVTQETATRQEVEQVQGHLQARQANLSEEVLLLKGKMNELREELETAARSWKNAEKENSANMAVLASRTQAAERRLENLERQAAERDSVVSKIEAKIRERVEAQSEADLEKMDKKLKIVLEEVSKENERLMRQIRTLQASSSGQGPGFHIVRSGESLSGIASQYGVNVQDLTQANNIANANSVRAGQRLTIPKRK